MTQTETRKRCIIWVKDCCCFLRKPFFSPEIKRFKNYGNHGNHYLLKKLWQPLHHKDTHALLLSRLRFLPNHKKCLETIITPDKSQPMSTGFDQFSRYRTESENASNYINSQLQLKESQPSLLLFLF